MSKTHKITQLKKRIAELEEKLNRREDIGSNPVRCLVVEKAQPIVIKKDRLLFNGMFSRTNAACRESLFRELLVSLADTKDFARAARVEYMADKFDPETIIVRAAIQVLPYYGDIWEEKYNQL